MPVSHKSKNWIILASKHLFSGFLVASFLFSQSTLVYSHIPNDEKYVHSFSSAVVTDLKIKGNRKSKIYHLPGCPNYDQIAPRNVVWFKTHQEAQNAGYRMARNC